MDPEVLRDRENRERKSLNETADLARRMTHMREFHQWLFSKHKAYSAGGLELTDRNVQGATLESY
jgi:site-specific recombinase XerC